MYIVSNRERKILEDSKMFCVITPGWVITLCANITNSYEGIHEIALRALRKSTLRHINHKQYLKGNVFHLQMLSIQGAGNRQRPI